MKNCVLLIGPTKYFAAVKIIQNSQ